MRKASSFTLSVWKRIAIVAVLLVLAVLTTIGPQPEEETSAAVRLAAEHDFNVRPDGLMALQELYDFQFDTVYDMVIGLTHEALGASDVDAALGFATDGKIKQLDLIRLRDDRGFFSVHHAAPVIREEVLAAYPVIAEAAGYVSAALDNDTMVRLNYLVGIEEREKYDVAKEWLQQGELQAELQALKLDSEGETSVRVAANQFTEYQILGNILLIMLETLGIPVEDHLQAPLFTLSRDGVLAGDLDIYWECSGADWYHVYSEEHTEDQPRVDGLEAVKQAAEYDAEQGLIWLEPAQFENTFAILMRKERAEELGIGSISDLANWARELQSDTR